MNLSTPVRELSLCAMDFETTGAVPGFPVEPWQVGMVAITNGRVVPESAFESWLRVAPDRPFNRRAPGRHAQIRDTLVQSPTMAELWPELEPRCVGVPIVAHNIGTERTMLTKSAPLHQFGPWVDTLALIRRVCPGLHSKALNDVVTALNLQSRLNELCPRAPHDALYDAFACAVLLEWLLSQPGWEQLPLRAVIA